MQLLKEGMQVDPGFGPYPHGMHFLLLAIHELTNANLTLLVNCFGSLVGVLIVIAIGDAARRLTGDHRAGLCAAALAAITFGGPTQYFIFGGGFQTADTALARSLLTMPYPAVDRIATDFDILLNAFRRQTVTLPQAAWLPVLVPGTCRATFAAMQACSARATDGTPAVFSFARRPSPRCTPASSCR